MSEIRHVRRDVATVDGVVVYDPWAMTTEGPGCDLSDVECVEIPDEADS